MAKPDPTAATSLGTDVGTWLEHHAAHSPRRIAIVDGDRRLDYAALHERSLRCAGVLVERGVRRGDRVALVLHNRSAYLEAIFAAARLGAIAVPVNTRFKPREIRRVLDDCTPGLLLHEESLTATVTRACDDATSPPAFRLACGGDPDAYEAALAATAPLERREAVWAEDPMVLLYTSGTTGVPKGALLPHRKTLYNSLNAEHFFELHGEDRVLVVLPLFHSFGLQILALPTLFAGARVVLQRGFDPEVLWQTVAREQISFFGGVPTMFQALLDVLDRDPAAFAPGSLRFLFTAGAAIPVEVIHGFQRHGLLLKQGFGQTETSILCCLDDADALRKAGSVGRPVRYGELRVVKLEDLEGPTPGWRDAAPGERGEIVVRGPINFLGYWQRPEASAEVLRDDWLRTGDLATVDEEGFVTLVGRARDMYISGGENVYPAEVEALYEEHPSVREIAVVGVPDRRWGEVGRAYVVLAPGAALDAEALRAWGAQHLADFKLPQSFVAVPSLPRTETGKVQKHRLG